MKLPAFAALFAVSVTSTAVFGQASGVDPTSIVTGTGARIVPSEDAANGNIKVTVLGVSRDSLRYRLASDATPQALAWNRVAKMDILRGRHRHIGVGAALGVFVGVVAGGMSGTSSASGRDGFTPRTIGEVSAIAGGVFGLLAGGLAGFFWKSGTWVPVAIPHPVR